MIGIAHDPELAVILLILEGAGWASSAEAYAQADQKPSHKRQAERLASVDANQSSIVWHP